jgi:quinol monooxygenase YgiN
MAITLVAKIKAKAGSEAQVEAAFREMIGKVRGEAGTLDYILNKSTLDPTTFVFIERYKDQDALSAHGKSEHMAALNGKLRGLLDGHPTIDMLAELDRK